MKLSLTGSLPVRILFLFFLILLFLTCTIRSGYIIDQSYQPRILILSVMLALAAIPATKGLKYNFYLVAFTLFFFWNLASVFWSGVASEALATTQLVFLSLALFTLISGLYQRYPQTETRLIIALFPVLGFSFLLGFYRMKSLHYFDPYGIVSICANNNLYAGFLLLSLGLVTAGYLLLKGFLKYLAVLTGVLALFFILITQSRAAYLGTLAASAILFAGLIWRYRRVFHSRNLITLGLALMLLTGMIILFYQSLDDTRQGYFVRKLRVWDYFIRYDTIQQKVIRKQQLQGDELQKIAPFDLSEEYYENANLRLIFWKRSFPLIREHPFTGAGAGQWRLVVPSVPEPENPAHTSENFTYSQPHNEWIGLLTELGIPGLLLAILLLGGLPLAVFILLVRNNPPPSIPALLYAAFLTGFLLYAAFDFPLRRVEHNLLLFAMLAFLCHRLPFKWFLPAIPAWAGRVMRLLLILLLLLSASFSLVRIRAEYFTLKVFRNERKNDAVVIRYSRLANSFFYRITPNTLPVVWFEGVARYRTGDVAGALENFNEALRYTPYEVRVLNDQATALWTLQRGAEARKTLHCAIALDPWFDDARLNLAAIFYFDGARDSARFYLNNCRQSERKSAFMKELDHEETTVPVEPPASK